MIIDFKEIPKANKGGGDQDRFEQFACDFLESIGFTIVRRPDRGPDGKKDLIVSETRTGVGGETTINWLVSCKHKVHSGAAVKDTDEPDIQDRVAKHNCHGFIGFYSTLQASSLSDKLYGLQSKIEYTTYDSTRIEKELLRSSQKERLLATYFPSSYAEYRIQKNHEDVVVNTKSINSENSLTEDDVLRIAKTAIIILEIEKIKSEFHYSNWVEVEKSLNKLYRYSNHSNEKVSGAVFEFLYSIAEGTRDNIPVRIASSLHSLVLTFFPSSYQADKNERIENGKQCVYIGFSLAYDAIIKLNNFNIAVFGLSIWKYIYREGQRNGIPDLQKSVLQYYRELEMQLDRPERTDLGNAKELIRLFKDDLETKELSFPVFPDHLYALMSSDD